MLNLGSLIINSIILLIVCTLPIPAIPFILNIYKMNGIYVGLFTTNFAGIGSAVIHYYLGRYFLNFLIRRKFKISYKKVIKLSRKVRKMTMIELIPLMLSSYIPGFIKCSACGAARVNLRRMIFACLIGQIPTQIIFILVGSNLYSFENKLFLLTNNKFVSFSLAISISSLIVFIIILLFRLFPKISKSILR